VALAVRQIPLERHKLMSPVDVDMATRLIPCLEAAGMLYVRKRHWENASTYVQVTATSGSKRSVSRAVDTCNQVRPS
jgi:hypothetical protein